MASLKPSIKLIRPLHIIKHFVILLPAIYHGDLGKKALVDYLIPILSFTIASSIGYVVNDLFDKDGDRRHPIKKYRPIASGEITIIEAIKIISLLSVILIITLAVKGNFPLTSLILLYLVLTTLYSLKIKRIFLLGTITVSFSFSIRLLLGYSIINRVVNPRLYFFVLIMGFLISLSKNIQEKSNQVEIYYTVLAPFAVIIHFLFITEIKESIAIFSTILIQIGVLLFTREVFKKNYFLSPFQMLFSNIKMLTLSVLYILVILWGIYL